MNKRESYANEMLFDDFSHVSHVINNVQIQVF